MTSLVRTAFRLASDPGQTWWICPLLWVFDAVLTSAIILKVPYTEIDWRAYMQQLSQIFDKQERNYAKIRGDTGPLVYPAGHVWIYKLLQLATGGEIRPAQAAFAGVYLATLALVMACYRRAAVPPWAMALLVLSKRLHSVYVLRLFNDGFAALGLWLAVALLQRRKPRAAAVAFSLGLAVKMSVLLALPGVAVVLYLLQGPWGAVATLAVMLQYQVIVAWPFLAAHPREYLGRAFEFGRVFLFKWTVNWRFVGEERFLSREFAMTLLVVHGSLIALFVLTRWTQPTGMHVWEVARSFVVTPSKSRQEEMARRATPEFVLATVLSANVIGILCARSLHYQFYAWLAWSSPYLLWRSGLHPVLAVAVWLAQEVAWNVYPSTNASSMVVVGCLAIQVAGIWHGTGPTEPAKAPPKQKVKR